MESKDVDAIIGRMETEQDSVDPRERLYDYYSDVIDALISLAEELEDLEDGE